MQLPDPKRDRSKMEVVIPNHFRCPISLDMMKDPVTLSSGITYDRESIETWLEAGNFTCPVTNKVLTSVDLVPNHTFRRMIQDWCVENRKDGVVRIPTPRVPITPLEVKELLFSIRASTQRFDAIGCSESLKKIKKLGSESEKNRRCIVDNGAAAELSAAFSSFARVNSNSNPNPNDVVLEDILSTLSWMFPLDDEAKKLLASRDSLRCIVRFVMEEDKENELIRRQSAVLVLKELAFDQKHAKSMADIEGIYETLVKLIKEPVSRTVTKASLTVIFSLVKSNQRIKSKFVEMNLVSLLINKTIIEAENNSNTECALGLLDELCESKHGREEAYRNALTMAVLVKKILRVSDLATEYAVSVVWKIIKSQLSESENEEQEEEERRSVMVEALQVGAFQKLVLLIQLGCGDSTKEKAIEVLKLLNPYRASGLECIESSDFKSLQRSF